MIAVDLVIGLMVVALAAWALTVRSPFTAVVLFIVYGIFVAIGWVRLEAVDVALAEAAIGAGITGVLLLEAIGALRGHQHSEDGDG